MGGEIAAGYAAGLITQEDAIIAAYLRGKAVAQNTAQGAMLAVGLGAEEAESYLSQYKSEIVVACHNSGESVTLSGDLESLKSIRDTLDANKKFARLLVTGGNAYHSHHMKAVGQAYEETLTKQSSQKPHRTDQAAKFFSSVLGHEMVSGVLRAAYWRQNLESPVLFQQAVSALVTTSPVDIFVEIGPHSALQGPLRQISKSISSRFPEYFSAMVRKNDNGVDLLTLAGNLFSKGYPVNLALVNANSCPASSCGSIPKVITDLPHYQWQYSDVLIHENRFTREWRLRMHPRHDILGSRIPGGVKNEPVWRNILRSKDLVWLSDHRVSQINMPQHLKPANQIPSSGLRLFSHPQVILPWQSKQLLKPWKSMVVAKKRSCVMNSSMSLSTKP